MSGARKAHRTSMESTPHSGNSTDKTVEPVAKPTDSAASPAHPSPPTAVAPPSSVKSCPDSASPVPTYRGVNMISPIAASASTSTLSGSPGSSPAAAASAPAPTDVEVGRLATTPNPRVTLRVTEKTDVREYHNEKGPGSLMKFTGVGRDGEALLVSAFNDAAHKFNFIKEGDIVTVSNFTSKLANQKYTEATYEATLKVSSIVNQIADDDTIPRVTYPKRIRIADLEGKQPGLVHSVIGIVLDTKSKKTVPMKGILTDIREITLGDSSGASVACTLWAEQVNIAINVGDVLGLKLAKTAVYSDTLMLSAPKVIEVNPRSCLESGSLRMWYEAHASGASSILNISAARSTFMDIAVLKSDSTPASCFDVLAIITDVGPIIETPNDFGDLVKKQNLIVVDRTGTITLTLTQKHIVSAGAPTLSVGIVLALKGVRLGKAGGGILTAIDTTSLVVNPAHPAAESLFNWHRDHHASDAVATTADPELGHAGGELLPQ